jgi:hypothetical protein
MTPNDVIQSMGLPSGVGQSLQITQVPWWTIFRDGDLASKKEEKIIVVCKNNLHTRVSRVVLTLVA